MPPTVHPGKKVYPFNLIFNQTPNLIDLSLVSMGQKTLITIPSNHLSKLIVKSLYLLLKPGPNPLFRTINIQTTGNDNTCLRFTLFKLCPSLFSNFEKEIAFKTAYKAYPEQIILKMACLLRLFIFQRRYKLSGESNPQ